MGAKADASKSNLCQRPVTTKTNTLEITKNRPHSSLISMEEDIATHGQMNR